VAVGAAGRPWPRRGDHQNRRGVGGPPGAPGTPDRHPDDHGTVDDLAV